jgi:hypothetical protein
MHGIPSWRHAVDSLAKVDEMAKSKPRKVERTAHHDELRPSLRVSVIAGQHNQTDHFNTKCRYKTELMIDLLSKQKVYQ